ncbi:glycosyltransferase family 2 protein [Pedobacter heparinus]|uniref:glycosyltransferase family 2 protein n=1 Tax=Pedobacter heparinus TaxID=984 RepID=UPI00292CCFDF|nr:glycosyltransferase [Pedobacter heparinus]
MTEHAYRFKEVTLLITHYNRSSSLGRLLNAFDKINCSFGDVVISDNASEPEHLDYIANLSKIHNFRLITSPVNKGLGNNINKGQDAVKTKYTVYIQDDFIPLPSFPEHFRDALEIMEDDTSWDLVSFYSYVPYPYLKPYKKGYSEKIFKIMPWYSNHLKFYVYGDHPHLRRSDFFTKFGRYQEGVNLDETERAMCLAFIKNKGKALFYDDHYGLLDQQNSESEPSTATYRKEWRQQKTPLVLFIKWFYLKYKFLKINFQLLIK